MPPKKPTISIALSPTEIRMANAIVRKWTAVRRKENPGAATASRSEAFQHALHRFFDEQFPEMAKRRNEAIQGVVGNHKKRFGDPTTMAKMKALTADVMAVGELELEDFLTELEAAAESDEATD